MDMDIHHQGQGQEQERAVGVGMGVQGRGRMGIECGIGRLYLVSWGDSAASSCVAGDVVGYERVN